MVALHFTGTVRDIQRAEKDMAPLLWEGYARVTHNSRRNGHIRVPALCADSFVVREYHVERPIEHGLVFEIRVRFVYRFSCNQAKVSISWRDASRLYSMLEG